MARKVVQPIIRKKKKRGGEEGHHGAAWKRAFSVRLIVSLLPLM